MLRRYRRHWFATTFPYILAIGLFLAILLQVIIGGLTQSADELPRTLWQMVYPFTTAVCYLGWLVWNHVSENRQKLTKTKRQKRQIRRRVQYAATAFLIALTAIFGGVLVNNYFRYFPTVGSIFGIQGDTGAQTVLTYSAGVSSVSPSVEDTLATLSQQTNGTVLQVVIPSSDENFVPRPAWVYVPAVESQYKHVPIPVLVLLAGVPGSPRDWLNGGDAERTLDAFAKAHNGITPLVVMPDDTGTIANDTECVNSPRGDVETYLTDDVPSYIKSHYDVSHNPANWGVGGLSMGGTCSLMLTLRHPNVYRFFADFSGQSTINSGTEADTIHTLFDDSKPQWAAHQPELLLTAKGAAKRYKDVSGFFGDGGEDSLDVTSAQKELYADAQAAGLDVAYENVKGEHDFGVWRQNLQDALPFASYHLGATNCSTSCK